MINQQIDVVGESTTGKLFYDIAGESLRFLDAYQKNWQKLVESEYQKFVEKPQECSLGIADYIIALANDCMKASEFTESITERVNDLLKEIPSPEEAAIKTQLIKQFNDARDAFTKLAKKCYTTCIDVILHDCKPAFTQLYTNSWYDP